MSFSTVIGRLFAIEYITAFFLRMPFEDSRKYLSLNEHLIEKGRVPSEDFQFILIINYLRRASEMEELLSVHF